jgi:hypothetical protein
MGVAWDSVLADGKTIKYPFDGSWNDEQSVDVQRSFKVRVHTLPNRRISVPCIRGASGKPLLD